MSDEKEGVKVDPECIQEALRTYFQPIKTEDPQLDFYTMYKRETTVYDAEYMQKYNEDLNTTLIFAGLFSAVSSAFVIDVQSKLEPDPGDQSEAYLRAILLSLNPSISPNEGPTAPSVWNGPPQEIITASGFLYASLLMSLLAAFVAMLGKQWLNRYLRHAGTSMVERCGDRQRKFNGLEKWPFRPFIESLPIMLQIALLLLTCGLSRYTWSVNTSVGRVVISFTLLGFLFYIGIVIAGVSSYECPFQTPASGGLRYLVDSGIWRKLLTSLRPANVLSLCHSIWRNARRILQNFSPPRITSLVYAALDALGRAVSASRRAFEITRDTPLEISPSRIIPCIRGIIRRVGDEFLIRLLQIDRVSGNAKQRLAQWFRRFRRVTLLPITDQPPTPPSDQGLRLHVRNLEALRRQNANNARCVSWVLRNITDPEAIDSAIRLARNIRWFDGDPNNDPPYDLIVSIFEACFDSTKEVYPSMRDRAYSSACAILQIHARARVQSNEGALRYPIPAAYKCTPDENEVDFRLYEILPILEEVSHTPRITLDLQVFANPISHSLWLSNLFVELTRVGPNPILKTCWAHLSMAGDKNNQAIIANILLMWYMFLGGRVEEGAFWTVDRSDSLEVILSHLSKRVMNIVVDDLCLEHLEYLLAFLAAWKERPDWLAPMAYLWCCAISGPPRRLGSNLIQFIKDVFELELFGGEHDHDHRITSTSCPIKEKAFALVGPGCDQIRSDYTPCCTRQRPEDLTLRNDVGFFPITLQIALRLANLPHGQSTLDSHSPAHYDRIFETIFSNEDDEAIADATCILVANATSIPPRSFFRYFPRRAERNKPFSPRLRRVSARVIEPAWKREVPSTSEIVYILNSIKADVGDFVIQDAWIILLLPTLRSPDGLEHLSSHYWELLGNVLRLAEKYVWLLPDIGVLRHLEQAEDWDRLEVWMAAMWVYVTSGQRSEVTPSLEDIERATLKLLSQKPSALPRFEDLCTSRRWGFSSYRETLRRICDESQAGRPHPRENQSLPRSSSRRPPFPPPSAEVVDDTD